MKSRNLWTILKDTFHEWSEDKASRLASSMAYYTLFSLAPLLVIAIAIAGFFFSRQQAQNQIVGQINNLVGSSAGNAISGMIANTHQGGSNIIATIVGVVLLLVGASGVFSSLQDSLNTIWGVRQDPKSGIKATIVSRIFSFAMVLAIGFLLLVSLVVSAALSVISTLFQSLLPGGASGFLFQFINFVVSFGVITLLFALIYKVLPDVDIAWREVWIGAAFTALLFTIGKSLIGLYLGRSTVTSVYGAAGSLVVILLWVYYSALILFFGAEFTQVYARSTGREMHPTRGAVWMNQADMANQGIVHEQPQRAPAPTVGITPYTPGMTPAMAVAGAGQGDRDDIRLPSYRSYPQNADLGRPPMPFPMRVLTGVVGALVATLGVTGFLFARTRAKPDQRLIQQGKQMQETARRLLDEAGQVRTQARQMHSATGRLDKMGSRLHDEGEKMRETGEKAIERGKHAG